MFCIQNMPIRIDEGKQMKPSDSELLSDFVARNLAREIETGEFSPGERLSEEAIARRFGVSRGPVREAIRQLAREELVVLRPRRGAVIPTLTPTEVAEMYEVRAALYAASVRLVARRVGRGEIPAGELERYVSLRQRLVEMAEDPTTTARDFAQVTQAISAFTVEWCGNRRLQESLGKMTRQTYRYYSELACGNLAHRKVITRLGGVMYAAILAGEAELASALAWRIVEANREAVLAQLESAPPGDAAAKGRGS